MQQQKELKFLPKREIKCKIDEKHKKPLSCFADREAHAGDTGLVHEIDDQFELVEAFEIGHFWCIARLGQCLETGLDKVRDTTAQNGLFTEQIGLGLFLEVGLDDAGLAATVGHGRRR